MKSKKSKAIFVLTVLALALILNEASYMVGRLFGHSLPHMDMTLPFDLIIPCIPFTVALYFVSFFIWLIFYSIIIGWEGWEPQLPEPYTAESFFSTNNRGRFLAADAVAKLICFLFFVFLPTTAIRPEVGGDTIWDTLMVFLYQIDPADNLFPSLHCLISWMCWIGLRWRKDIHPVMRHLPLILAILICISTLTTKQHVILDVFGGMFFAEFSWWIAGFPKIRRLYEKPVGKLLNSLISGTR